MKFSKPVHMTRLILLGCLVLHGAFALAAETLAPVPRNINSETSKPIVMFVTSKDHTLFSPAFTDFEPLDESKTETTFKPTFEYYGYFDAAKCYEYNSSAGRFDPKQLATKTTTTTGGVTRTRYSCTAAQSYWSGNFLNWASMSRLDVVRKMLYGGKRSTDALDLTVLERADLSQDAHSFVKFYAGDDIRDYTPFTTTALTKTTGENATRYAGLTICNRSDSPGLGGNPVMRIAKGNFRLWATIETRTCTWGDKDSPNSGQVKLGAKLARYYGNSDAAVHGGASIKHESALPRVDKDGIYSTSAANDFTLRVRVCDSALLGKERCEAREWRNGTTTTTTIKPIGLLQEFGLPAGNQTGAKAEIGLLSGSYDSGLTAGALRKTIGDMTMEVSQKSGRLCIQAAGANDACPSSVPGAIATLDNIKLVNRTPSGYSTIYNTAAAFEAGAKGQQPAWGNPMGEMLVQALNYLAGTTSNNPTTKTVDAANNIPVATWDDPLNYAANSTRAKTYGRNVCRAINTIAISSSANSFDQNAGNFNSLPGLGSKTVADFTNTLGALEGINNSRRAVGTTNGTFGSDCSAKTLGNLSDVSGICPDAPSVGGSYMAAGAAYYANNTNIKSGLTVPDDYVGTGLRVKTSAAALAGGVPRIEVTVPSTGKKVFIVPEGKWGPGDPAGLLTFSAINSAQDTTAGTAMGSYLVTWNDALVGGDHDMDATGYLRWDLIDGNTNEPKIKITTDMVNVGSGAANGTHGYSVIGVNNLTASASSTVAADYADGLYITHGHSRAAGAVDTPGTMCANADYRSTTAAAGTYTVTAFPNHVATRVSSGGAVRNPCFNSTTNWAVVDVDLPVVGTFKIRGADSVTLQDPLWYAAKYGSFDTTTHSTSSPYANSPAALPTAAWDADGDSNPDTYYLARRPELLDQKLRNQLQQIAGKANTATAVSNNILDTGSFAFKTAFNPSTKTGSLYAYSRNSDNTGFSTAFSFDAGTLLDDTWNTRPVITNLDSATGEAFRWGSLNGNAAYKESLTGVSTDSNDVEGAALVQHIRGSRTNESPLGEQFKARDINTVLGTVVNSSPVVLRTPEAAYTDSQFSDTAKYSTFFSTWQSRPALVWVGSNDGMLHAFDSGNGTPVLSFLPKELVTTARRLAKGLDEGIVAGMDGSPFIGDVRIKNSGDRWEWRTYVFSHLGRGGRGLYALDSTDTAALKGIAGSNLTSERSAAASVFKFAFTNVDEPELGNVIPVVHRTHTASNQPTPIVRLNTGEFAILVPNGINSDSETAKLMLVKVQGPTGTNSSWVKGTDYYMLDTYATDTNNGMMGATWVDTDLNGTADFVYGTDLKGNVWKFDITSATPSQWGSAFKSEAGANVPFYTATDAAGNAIPLTTDPALYTSNKGTMVVFGSGKATSSSDFPNTSYQQRMFAVYDKSVRNATSGLSAPRPTQDTSKLQEHSWLTIETGEYKGYAYEAPFTADTTKNEGWFFDLPGSSEMLLSTPDRLFGNVVFTTHRAPDANTTDCFVTPPIRVWSLDPATGVGSGDLGVMTLSVNGSSVNVKVAGKPTDSSTTTVAKRRTGDGSGGTKQCAELVGDVSACRALKPRLQWREVPGFSTSN